MMSPKELCEQILDDNKRDPNRFAYNTGTIQSLLLLIKEMAEFLEQMNDDIHHEFCTNDGTRDIHDSSCLKCTELLKKWKGDK